jgi:hypothetical protein
VLFVLIDACNNTVELRARGGTAADLVQIQSPRLLHWHWTDVGVAHCFDSSSNKIASPTIPGGRLRNQGAVLAKEGSITVDRVLRDIIGGDS